MTGGAGFLVPSLCEGLLEQGTKCCASIIFSPARDATWSISSINTRFELMRHDVTFPLYVEVDEIYNLACPASPNPLPARSGADDEDVGASAQSTCWASPSG